MTEERICPICKKSFLPNKYRPNQKICSSIECQYKRQLDNMKDWRGKNPHYFKYKEMRDANWKETCRQRARLWRQGHLEYLKLYRQEHKESHKEYMRKYMREYRRRKKEKEALKNNPASAVDAQSGEKNKEPLTNGANENKQT